MKLPVKFIAFAFVLASAFSLKAQDPHFTQCFSNPFTLNPAFTGSAGCSRITADIRNEPSITEWYNTAAGISYDQYVHPLRSGLGFNFSFDKEGSGVYNYHSNVLYSYIIKIKRDFNIVPAINIGFGVRDMDIIWDFQEMNTPYKLNNEYIFAPEIYPEKLTKYYFNIGSGLILSYNNSVFGFSCDHLNRPDIGFWNLSRMPVKYIAHWSSQFNIKEIASITPAIVYMKHNPYEQMMFSVLGRMGYIKTGIGTRFDLVRGYFDCISGTLGFQNKWMSIGYSYDFPVDHQHDGT
jgi:type IX secretion system PorP/SprF family membrane protein